ncbi:MAG: DUF4214 domain-containing protein, partial [Lachnospiraceae bacterium]|nr:DUF4214 domain-containing protein [Lachnospiraceae bacterium]
YNVFSIEMTGREAYVELEAVEDCILLVAIYDEAGEQLIASGSLDIVAGDEAAITEIDIAEAEMPQYFYLRGYLVEKESYRPLCTVYESPNYTQEMQEFFAKTTNDFEEDRVLNLDESTDNNFAIYGEDTIVVEENNTNNQFNSIDEEEMIYVVENADASVTSLAVGDIFVYEAEDEVIIIKVAHIEVDGTTATIYGSEASMEEVFSYVKIDGESDVNDVTVDTSQCDEDVEYQGKVETQDEYETESIVRTESGYELKEDISGDTSKSTKLQYNLGKKTNLVNGSVGLKLTTGIEFYLTRTYQYMEVKIDYTIDFNVSIKGEIDKELSLGKAILINYFGVNITADLKVIFEFQMKLELVAKLTGKIGIQLNSETGVKDITSAPKLKTKLKGEINGFIGVGITPSVKVISKKCAEAKLKSKVGVEIEAELTYFDSGKNIGTKHGCAQCVDGVINFVFSTEFSATLFKKWKFKYSLFDIKVKICDWYYSFDTDQFGIGKTCPNKSTCLDMYFYDQDSNVITGAIDVSGKNKSYNFSESSYNGHLQIYLPKGTYYLDINAEGYVPICKKVVIGEKRRNVTVNLILIDLYAIESMEKISLGGNHSGAIDSSGQLYMWGDNSYGQLGDGTTQNKVWPTRVFTNVKEISLGAKHSAVITKSGQLYMWGDNSSGQLGNGNTNASSVPIKVLSNVKEVALGRNHSAAITNDGSLYTWGDNRCGQLGNGTYNDSYVPIKVMDNVKAVDLGGTHTGAITKDGSLYMWGNNNRVQLGFGTGTGSVTTPKKFMDNVSVIDLGDSYTGAITKDGSLYMWGWNNWYQISNSIVYYQDVPLKIRGSVKDLNLGTTSSSCITTDGKLYTWGDNSLGELGIGNKVDGGSPYHILDGVKDASLGGSHGGAITASGNLYMWGYNNVGQIGNGTYVEMLAPNRLKWALKPNPTYALEAVTDIYKMHETVNVNAVSGTLTYDNLIPDTNYNLYVMKSQTAEDIWDGDNLLYVKQTTSDASGNVSVSYHLREDYENAEAFLVCAKQTDLSSATITVKNLTYNGKEQFVKPVVKLNGQTLVEGRDYDLEGNYFAKDTGKYTVTIRGIGMYCGTKDITYSVVKKASGSTGNTGGNTGDNTGGNTGESGGSTSEPSQADQIEAFVKRMYTVALNREAEAAGLNDWSSQLAEQKIDGAGIANGFINSVEFTNRNLSNTDFLDTLYQTFFNRPADAGGKAYWLQQLWNGMSRTEVLSGFVNSQEFSNLCDNYGIARGTMQPNGSSIYRPGVRNYVLRMYTKALNRAGETVGVEDWTNRINTGTMSAEKVAKSFFNSEEFINRNLNDADYVETLYQTFMDRPSDADGKQYWLNKLDSGMSREQVLEGFSRSREFTEIMSRYGL